MAIKKITEYIFINDKNPKSDVALVFGTWNAWRDSVEKAAELYKNGFVPKIIISHGINPTTGVAEGELMMLELEKLGVPKKDILLENRATNTLENVLFSKEVMEKELGLAKIRSITAVVKNYHARRAMMTLRKHIPKNVRLKCAAYISSLHPLSKYDWYKTEKGKRIVMEEVEKIKKYLDKGDLAEIQV